MLIRNAIGTVTIVFERELRIRLRLKKLSEALDKMLFFRVPGKLFHGHIGKRVEAECA